MTLCHIPSRCNRLTLNLNDLFCFSGFTFHFVLKIVSVFSFMLVDQFHSSFIGAEQFNLDH